MIISTGMADMADVFTAVETIRNEGNNDIVVLQCTTNYPSKIDEANLLAMQSIKEACKVTVGYSDHVENNYACFASVALGAEIVEKHLTLNKQMKGPESFIFSRAKIIQRIGQWNPKYRAGFR